MLLRSCLRHSTVLQGTKPLLACSSGQATGLPQHILRPALRLPDGSEKLHPQNQKRDTPRPQFRKRSPGICFCLAFSLHGVAPVPGERIPGLHVYHRGGSLPDFTIYTCPSPPSTNNSAPVIKLLSSEARKTTAFATSSAVPGLPRGVLAASSFLRC